VNQGLPVVLKSMPRIAGRERATSGRLIQLERIVFLQKLVQQHGCVFADFDDLGAEARVIDVSDFDFAEQNLFGIELALELEYLTRVEEFLVAHDEESARAEIFDETRQRRRAIEEGRTPAYLHPTLRASFMRFFLWVRHQASYRFLPRLTYVPVREIAVTPITTEENGMHRQGRSLGGPQVLELISKTRCVGEPGPMCGDRSMRRNI
jgi:hypothetical protein